MTTTKKGSLLDRLGHAFFWFLVAVLLALLGHGLILIWFLMPRWAQIAAIGLFGAYVGYGAYKSSEPSE